MSRHPTIKWAQRSDKLFITVELPDAKNVKLKLEPEGKFLFSATAGADDVPYEVDLDLFDKINVDESKSSTTSRSIVYLVKKAEDKWWSRLIKQEGLRPVFLKVDWDKWVDEDEEDGKRKYNVTRNIFTVDISHLVYLLTMILIFQLSRIWISVTWTFRNSTLEKVLAILMLMCLRGTMMTVTLKKLRKKKTHHKVYLRQQCLRAPNPK